MLNIIKKSSIVLISVVTIRILSSCIGLFGGDCDSNVIYYDIDHMQIEGIDNSGEYTIYEEKDTMKSAAVAFKVNIEADSLYYLAEVKNTAIFGFSQAKAWECETYYKANQDITGIKITTVFDISSRIPANSDISKDILFNADNNDIGKLYSNFEDIKSYLNKTENYIGNVFYIFYKNAVQNDSVQFVVELSLSDGRAIVDTSNVIRIVR